MGFPRTGVFPLLLDLRRILSIAPNPDILATERGGAKLLFVGRIAPNKRIEDLLRVLAEYRKLDGNARLFVVGNDAQHPQYLRTLADLGKSLSLRIGTDAVFTGKVPDADMAAYFRAADAFVCMSEHEGFCAPLIESMAFGVPVFAYDAGATAETLGGAGVLFGEKNYAVIAQEIHRVVEDRNVRAAMLADQYKRAEAFSIPRQQEQLQLLLKDLSNVPIPKVRGRQPAVSIVINTYNRGVQLERCLHALRQQDYANFEVVVVNGPSTDDTIQRLKRFENCTRIVQTESRILSVSRNLGIANSRGELVAFLDDDAIAEPGWLTEMIPAFEDPSVGGAGGKVFRMNGRDIEFRNGIINRFGIVRWDEAIPGTHWHWEDGWLNTVSGNNCMFRRAALETVGGFDERIEYYHDEADVVMKIEKAGFRTVHRPQALVYHEAAKSHNRHAKYALNWFAITKNTLYCALKNYTGDESKSSVAARIAGQLIHLRMRPIGDWRRAGEIGSIAWLRMEWACARGIATGLYRGMFGGSKPGVIPDASGEILTYPTGALTGPSIGLISQTLPAQSSGGIATYTMTLARSLRDLGCTVHVISAGETKDSQLDQGIWFHTAKPAPIGDAVAPEFPTLRKNLDYSNGVRLAVLDIAARSGLDVIESPNWDFEGLLGAMEHRLPVVVRVHSPLFKVMETQEWAETEDLLACCDAEGLLLKHADGVSGSTEAILKLVDGRYGLAKKNTALIPLGLDIASAVARKPGAGEGCTVLFVGRLERRKGIHTLLAAIPEILRRAPKTKFELVGRDIESQGNGIRSWADRWRMNHPLLASHVRFHGEVDDATLRTLYADCDVFVAPSLYESFGLIFLEAMAHGKPVVGTNAGGIPEVVAHNETGILIPPGDSSALAAAILKLIDDESLRMEFGRAGRARFEQSFTPQAMGTRTLEFYRDVMKRWNSAAGVAWLGRALDSYRHPSTQIVWVPETGAVCMCAEAGEARTIWYGPYVSLEPGMYRAEFTCWISDAAAISRDNWICTMDVSNIDAGFLAEARLTKADLKSREGWITDVFFTVDGSGKGNYEFRVHTSGAVDLYVRQVKVRRWPPVAVPSEASPRTWRESAARATAGARASRSLL
jgi:glycosyltransferase involved in cell wall biosynthesis/GT2 family glycosyltransferase